MITLALRCRHCFPRFPHLADHVSNVQIKARAATEEKAQAMLDRLAHAYGWEKVENGEWQCRFHRPIETNRGFVQAKVTACPTGPVDHGWSQLSNGAWKRSDPAEVAPCP